METLHGQARFLNENTVELEDGKKIQARKFLIASGARPRDLVFEGADYVIDLRRNASVTGIRKTVTGLVVIPEQDGRGIEVKADLVVHGAGRVPAIDHLDLNAARIASSDSGVNQR